MIGRLAMMIVAVGVALMNAQPVEVHQGTAAPTEFHSPMIIDTIFIVADRSRWQVRGKSSEWFTSDEYHDLGKYRCDGLSLRQDYDAEKGTWESGLSVKPQELESGDVETRVRLSVFNPKHNHDKLVTVTLEVRNGEKVVGMATIGPWKVEDKGRENTNKGTIIIPASELSTNPTTALRITVSAQDV